MKKEASRFGTSAWRRELFPFPASPATGRAPSSAPRISQCSFRESISRASIAANATSGYRPEEERFSQKNGAERRTFFCPPAFQVHEQGCPPGAGLQSAPQRSAAAQA